MDALAFAHWLQGYVELTGKRPTAAQWKSIREHLALVFTKVTPPVGKGRRKNAKNLDEVIDRLRHMPVCSGPMTFC